jgi:hypothetical protein
MKDISEGGLAVTGEYKFTVGDWVEVSIMPPKYGTQVTLLAEVKWAKSFTQDGKEMNTAGFMILALDNVSMEQLGRYILAERNRLQVEKNSSSK